MRAAVDICRFHYFCQGKLLRHINESSVLLRAYGVKNNFENGPNNDLKHKLPVGKLDDTFQLNIEKKHPYAEKEPLPPWPNNTNPSTGEKGGPRGPEPTRYGDWERKGRVSDF